MITRDLIMNVDSDVPSSKAAEGASGSTLHCNSTLTQKIRVWMCGEEVSCADHNIIFFEIDSWANGKWTNQYTAKR